MPTYPIHTFSDFSALLNYINTEVVTNGNEEIDAIIMNDVVNGLLTFIEQSPLNSAKGSVITSGENVTLNNPVTLVSGTTPTSLTFGDNIYNQWVIINSLSIDIPNVTSYKDILGNVRTSIPKQSVLNLVKLSNGDWVNINRNTKTETFQIVVGVTLDDNGDVIMDNTTVALTINEAGVQVGSVHIFNGTVIPFTADGVESASCGIVYFNSKFIVNFSQPYDDKQIILLVYTFSY